MTENERMSISGLLDVLNTGISLSTCHIEYAIKCNVLEELIRCLEEIQQYREIGTVKEFKALKEKEERFDRNIKMFNEIGLEIRAKAIDEFVEKLSLEISESIIWDMLATMSKNGSLSDTSDKIVDYVIETSKKIAEQLKTGGIE